MKHPEFGMIAVHPESHQPNRHSFAARLAQIHFRQGIESLGKIREEFENGRDYYALDNRELRKPENQLAFPSTETLKYHYENEFRG